MIDYGRTESTIKPEAVEIHETTVFEASNITEITREQDGEIVTLYQFNYVEYDKDEYIKTKLEQNAANIDYISMMSDIELEE